MQSDIKTPTIYRPFANRSQFMDWLGKNCCCCSKSYAWTAEPCSESEWMCVIEQAIWESNYGTGNVSEDIAKRMNYLRADGSLASLECAWPCAEIEPTSELAGQAVQYWRELHAK